MTNQAIGTADEIVDMRALTDAELEEANGGFIFLALGLAAGFAAGFTGGCIAANYAKTGNFWGDI